ncbi:NADPH:quinone reductase [Pigmentiphaga soli]|uniref:NADPH:quinone reductase n=1 Tax=Pigmentiphaga soli TaxID=1007095 RepID=A0ABP8H094_9BURK
MRAAWYERNGEAEAVLQLGDLPAPEPGPGEVRVRLAASGVNPSDVKSRAGSRPVAAGTRIVPHSDGAGVIDKVGEGVPAARVGERVWVWNGQYQRPLGTCAQFIALPAAQAVPLPEGASFEAGACLGIPAMTAIHAVDRLGDVAGKTVLVTGATSGVGFYAAQVARLRGARVIGTVGSGEKARVLAGVGIEDVIFYKTEPVAERILAMTGGKGVDGIVDMDFSTTSRLVPAGALAPFGQFVCYGSNDRGEIPVEFGAWLPRSLGLQFFLVYELPPAARRQAVDGLNALLSDGSLAHLVAPAYALDDIAAAHQAVESGRVLGNVVVALPD